MPTSDTSPPPPPPSPASSPERHAAVPPAPPAPPARKRQAPPHRAPSSRLAAKEQDNYVSTSTRATQLKAIKNTLASCSRDRQDQVVKHGLMHKQKKPLGGTDLRAAAAGISSAATASLNKVLSTKE
ncbi:unnamed protein product [Urochloa humidicola]